MRLGMRRPLSPSASMASHTSRAAMRPGGDNHGERRDSKEPECHRRLHNELSPIRRVAGCYSFLQRKLSASIREGIGVRRRECIALLGGAAAAWPIAAYGQGTDRVRRIGVLMASAPDDLPSQCRI